MDIVEKSHRADELAAAFEKLKKEDPETFYDGLGYGNALNLLHPFYSGSYEMGVIVGAMYALEHLSK